MSVYTGMSHIQYNKYGIADGFLEKISSGGSLVSQASLFNASMDQVLYVAAGDPSVRQLLVATQKKMLFLSQESDSDSEPLWTVRQLSSVHGQYVATSPLWWTGSKFILRVDPWTAALLDVEQDTLTELPELLLDVRTIIVADPASSLLYTLQQQHCGYECDQGPLLTVFSFDSTSLSQLYNVSLHPTSSSSADELTITGVLPQSNASLLAFCIVGEHDGSVCSIDTKSGQITSIRTLASDDPSVSMLLTVPSEPNLVYGWNDQQQSFYTFNASTLVAINSIFVDRPDDSVFAQSVAILTN